MVRLLRPSERGGGPRAVSPSGAGDPAGETTQGKKLLNRTVVRNGLNVAGDYRARGSALCDVQTEPHAQLQPTKENGQHQQKHIPERGFAGVWGQQAPNQRGRGGSRPPQGAKMDACRNGGVGAGAPTARRRSADTRHTAGGAEPKRGTAEERRARGDSGPPKGGAEARTEPKGEGRKARGRAGQPARGPALGGQGGPSRARGAQRQSRGRAGGRGEGGEQPPEGATPRTRDRAPTRGGRRPAGPWPEDASPPKWGRGSGKPQATGEQQRNFVLWN